MLLLCHIEITLYKISGNSVYKSWNHSILQSGNLETLISILMYYLIHLYTGKCATCVKRVVFKTHLKPRCWEPPGHYLCTPEAGRPGCVISIEKGVIPAEPRVQRKHSLPLYISHRRDLNAHLTHCKRMNRVTHV